MKLINTEIRFEVTNRCNARCIMCPREKMKRPQGVLDPDLYKKVLDEAIAAGADKVSLENYGETFLDPYIFERAAYARSKGMEVYTITNGSLLTEESCESIIKFFNKIRISLYGMSKDVYDKIHRGLSFETVTGNIERLFRAREKYRSNIKIELYFLLMKENEHQMKAFLDKYEKTADAVSIWKPHNWGDGRNYREALSAKKITCGRPLIGPVQVQWDGLVVPCCFDYDSRIVLGDLKKQTLHEALHGDAYNALRRAHESGEFSKYPFCDVCDQLQKRDDVLVYTTIKNSKIGATNTAYDDLTVGAKKAT